MNIEELKRLAGVDNVSTEDSMGEKYQRKHNIKPGTDEWFRLWFAQTKLTGENPMPKNK